MRSPQEISRRASLHGLAGGALALPFLSSLVSDAQAQAAIFPTRLLIFHTANGQPMRLFRPDGVGVDYRLSPVLEPLAPFRQKINIIGGLDMSARGGENGHETGTLTVLTGAEPTARAAGGAYAGGAFPRVGNLHLDLITAAFTCDLTRVASLQWQEGSNNVAFDGLTPAVRESHHELSHAIVAETAPMSTQAERNLVAINRCHVEQFAGLLTRLDSVVEGDGTLLGHCVVLWTNELSDMPFVMAGGANGYFRTGRSLVYPRRPHNSLLVSLAQGMGMRDVQRFGDFGEPRPLPGLTA